MNIYEQAVATFGKERQIRKAVEELTELSLALQHYLDNKASKEDVELEIIDCEILLAQLYHIFGVPKLDLYKLKLDKLNKHIQNEQTNTSKPS